MKKTRKVLALALALSMVLSMSAFGASNEVRIDSIDNIRFIACQASKRFSETADWNSVTIDDELPLYDLDGEIVANVAGLPDGGEILALHASSSHEITEQWELTEPEEIGRVLAVLRRSRVLCPFPSLTTGTMIHITAEVAREDGTVEKVWIYASGPCSLTINGMHHLVVGLPGTRDAWRALLG